MSFYANYSSALGGGGGGGGGGPFLPLAGGTMSGNINMQNNDILSNGRVSQGSIIASVFNGVDYFPSTNLVNIALYSTIPIAAQTTHLPSNPIVGQTIAFSMIGGGYITAWTLVPEAGTTIYPSAPTSIAAGQTYIYFYTVIGPNKYWILTSQSPNNASLPITGGTLTGSLLFSPDGSLNIGAPTDTRPNIYANSLVDIGSDALSTLNGPQFLNIGGAQFEYNIATGNQTLLLLNTTDGNAVGNGLGALSIIGGLLVSANASFLGAGNVFSDESAGVDNSAVVNIDSTTRGVLFPRMTTTQKNAIASPTEGLVVYDLTLHALSLWNGSVWQTVTAV